MFVCIFRCWRFTQEANPVWADEISNSAAAEVSRKGGPGWEKQAASPLHWLSQLWRDLLQNGQVQKLPLNADIFTLCSSVIHSSLYHITCCNTDQIPFLVHSDARNADTCPCLKKRILQKFSNLFIAKITDPLHYKICSDYIFCLWPKNTWLWASEFYY